jgi:acyl transferase domain-containing protein
VETDPALSWELLPQGATAHDLTGFYARGAMTGASYGPAFQGLSAAWQMGEMLYGEVSLPQEHAESAGKYVLHPALFDAALHLLALPRVAGEGNGVFLPFSWSGVTLHALGARSLRVRLKLSGGSEQQVSASLTAFDETDQLVLSVERLDLRRASVEHVRAGTGAVSGDLYHLEYQPASLS